MTTRDWPEYCYLAKLDSGRWRAEVQNKRGDNVNLDFKDPMMAERFAIKQREALGVEKELEVFHK